MEEFLKRHNITYYTIDVWSQVIHFNIDGNSYELHPFYKGNSMSARFPSGYSVRCKIKGSKKVLELFSFFCIMENNIEDIYSIAYLQLSKEIKMHQFDIEDEEGIPYIIWELGQFTKYADKLL